MSVEQLSSNKRLAKNTLLLYFRMLFMMAISLYTSRIVLAVLGVDDFGIYNVVGGIVTLLSFLNTSMASATQRFMNIQIGKNDKKGLHLIFSTAQVIHILISVIILLLGETIGLWFLNNCMNISPNRIEAANWVFQFTILSFILTVISVPYNAAIISHEKMSAFAYISIVEAVLKLLMIFLLDILPTDKLIIYAAMMGGISIIIRFIYGAYCSKHFEECKSFCLKYDRNILKQMLGFSGWTIFGALGSLSHTQGIAIIINMFFGVAVNAAQGLSNQITNVVNNFVTNFMTALNPQIVKSYASGDLQTMQTLLKRGSRMGISLVAFFAIPIIIETPKLFSIWLTEVPEYTVIFVRIVLLTNLCNAYASPLATAKGATGDIKKYQIILTTIGWCHLPFAWIAFKYGGAPYYAMYIYFILVNIMQAIRIYMVCISINMSIYGFYVDVILRCVIMLVIASLLPIVSHLLLPDTIISCITTMIIGFLSVLITTFMIVATSEERTKLLEFAKSKIQRK